MWIANNYGRTLELGLRRLHTLAACQQIQEAIRFSVPYKDRLKWRRKRYLEQYQRFPKDSIAIVSMLQKGLR